MGRVNGKVAIVTGAGGGQGEAEARLLAAEGAKVVATDINLDRVTRVVAEINEQYPGSAMALWHDVSSQSDWQDVVEQTVAAFGPITILVNNAGILAPAAYDKVTFEHWQKTMNVNAWSQFVGMQTVIPHMRAAGGGSIINVASLAVVNACGRFTAYTASKGAYVEKYKMRLKRSRTIGQVFVPMAIVAALSGCNQEEAVVAAPAPKVGVFTVHAQPLALTSDLPGRTVAYRVAEVRPQVSGIVQKRLFAEGAQVREGQQLYQIDPRTYAAQLARSEATLATTGNLAKRYERLLQVNAVSRQEHDDAVAAWQQAQADYQMARINVQYTKVMSPISGRIGRSDVTEGALVTNGQAQQLTTITQLDPIYVDVTQPITKMLGLQKAVESGRLQGSGEEQAKVSLVLDDGSTYPIPGVLKFSEVRVDPTTGSVTLRAEFPNPQHRLLPGMFVRAQLTEGVQQRAMLVPQQAVVRDARGNPSVWVVKADNSVERRAVETLRTVGNAWLVGNGINDGDKVITEGVQAVRNGIAVEPQAASNVSLVANFDQPAVAAD
ncbi:solvent efflux pump periplasmic linker srpA [Pseudomonas aeruginosa str. Stone 130]|nr:solvent efflux pump periplasmic linker srpA [Pseudomonas aeruginosa str. Stone 130]